MYTILSQLPKKFVVLYFCDQTSFNFYSVFIFLILYSNWSGTHPVDLWKCIEIRAVGAGWGSGGDAPPHPEFGRSVNPIPTEGQIIPTTTRPANFQTLPRPCQCYIHDGVGFNGTRVITTLPFILLSSAIFLYQCTLSVLIDFCLV